MMKKTKAITLTNLTMQSQAAVVQSIVVDLMQSDPIQVPREGPLESVDYGYYVLAPFFPLGRDVVGLEVVFYTPEPWNQCLHRGVVVDQEDDIVDIEWKGAIMDRVRGGSRADGFENLTHVYEVWNCAVLQ